MHYSAILGIMASTTQETPHTVQAELMAGRFHENQSYATWRSRGTVDWLLIYTLAGRGRFGYPGGEFTTVEHDIVLIRPHAPHDYGTAAGFDTWDLVWAHFQPPVEWRELLDWPEAAPGVLRLHVDAAPIRANIIAALDKTNRYSHGPLRRRMRFAVNALEQALLWCDTVNPRAASAKMDPRVHVAIDYLLSHIAEKVSVADVADASGLSVSRIAHLFQEQVGQTPQQFLETERLDRARQLLRVSDQPIHAIAAGLGFESAFYFSRRFKHHFGLSPRDYRARQG